LDDFSSEQRPAWGESSREVYTPEQYAKLLAASDDDYVTRFLVLSGIGFFRTEELVKKFRDESVLEWEDFHPDFIHVRREVSKTDERDVELGENPALRDWLKRYMEGKALTGAVIPLGDTNFRQRLQIVFKKSGVEPVHNGLRHSAISYYIAMYQDVGVARVSAWAGNSESILRRFYLRRGIRPDQAEAWFRAVS
jgi:hypothetical protein